MNITIKLGLLKYWSVGVGVFGAIALGNISSVCAFNLYNVSDLGIVGSEGITISDINDAGQTVGSFRTGNDYQQAFISQNGVATGLSNIGVDEYSYASSINELGQVTVVSTFYSPERSGSAFLWQNGVTTDLGEIGVGAAFDINNAGQVIGHSYIDGVAKPFIWQNGIRTDLGVSDNGYALKINEAGQVLGIGWGSNYNTNYYGFVWQNGIITNFSGFNGDNVIVRNINEAGQVLAYSYRDIFSYDPFVWQNGTITEVLPQTDDPFSSDMNESGQIVGSAKTSDNRNEAFIWENGTMKKLVDVSLPERVNLGISPYDINNNGQVIGSFGLDIYGEYVNSSFLWENGEAVDLKNLIAPNSGWERLFARKINNKGQIVGDGHFQGQYRGFIMTPTDMVIDPESIADTVESIPEPSSIIGSILGIGSLVATARRRRFRSK
jgi:probable HAF family extracellular repeat protein